MDFKTLGIYFTSKIKIINLKKGGLESREYVASSAPRHCLRGQTSPDPLYLLICGKLGGRNHPRTPSPVYASGPLCDLRASPDPLWPPSLFCGVRPLSPIPEHPQVFWERIWEAFPAASSPPWHFNLSLTRHFNRHHFSREFIKTCKHG